MALKKRILKTWSTVEEKLFKNLVKQGTPTGRIARQLKRTTASIRSKAQKFGLSLGLTKKKPARKARAKSRR
jgi:hypothetical protein